MKKITYLYLIFASAVFFFMALSGLNNECVPGKDIKELSFYSLSGKTKGILIKRMADFKEEHKEIVEKNLYDGIIWQFLPPEGYLLDMERENKENIGGETLYISKNKMRWLSNNLISPSVWDEQTTFRMFYALNPKNLDFNPRHFRYGGAWFYPTAAIMFTASKMGTLKLVKDFSYYLNNPEEIRLFSIIGKLFGIFSYLAVIFISLFLALRFYNLRVGILAVFFMAFCPITLVESVYFKPFLTASMYLFASVLFILRMAEGSKVIKRDAIFAGIFAGLAMGSLLTCGSIIISIFLAIFHKHFSYKGLKIFTYAVISFLSAYLISNFYILFSPGEFVKYVLFYRNEWKNTISFFDINMHLQNIWSLFSGFGWPFGILIFIALIWLLLRGGIKERLILSTIAAYYFFAFYIYSLFKNPHFLVPIIPIIILTFAIFMDNLISSFNKKKVFIYLICIFTGLHSVLYCLFYVSMLKTSPRILAGEWINRNLYPGTTIGTFIDNQGLAYHYPYFNYFQYRFINDSDTDLSRIKAQQPQYYISTIGFIQKFHHSVKESTSSHFTKKLVFNEEKEISPFYKEIMNFKGEPEFLSRFFKNTLLEFWTKEIKIYKLQE